MLQILRTIKHQLILTAIIFFVSAFLLPPEPISAQQNSQNNSWQTKQFEVRWHSPYPEDDDLPQPLTDWLNKKRPTAVERLRYIRIDKLLKEYLAEIAEYYESNKISEPYLPLDNGKWVIYAYDFDSGVKQRGENRGGHYQSSMCGSILAPLWVFLERERYANGPVLAMDVGHLLGTKEITDVELMDLYSTLAHELFHAIQAAYDRKWSSILWCKDDDGNGLSPLIEGTATAATAFALEDKYEGFTSNLSINDPEVGAFPYYKYDFMSVASTYTEEEKEGGDPSLPYKTSSFWKYLADKYGGLEVFDTIFSSPIVGNISNNAEPTLADRYKWLDKIVKKITLSIDLKQGKGKKAEGKGLYLVLPEFFAELASYPDSKFINYEKIKFNIAGPLPDWVGNVYRGRLNGCHEVQLTKANKGSDELELSGDNGLVPNGTTCIEVEWSGMSTPFKIEVAAVHPKDKVLDQLHLGVASLSSGETTDFCIDWIDWSVKNYPGGFSRANFDCSFGKNFIKFAELEKGETGYKDSDYRKIWDLGWSPVSDKSFTDKLKESGSAILILSNVNVDPGKTTEVPGAKSKDGLKIRFSVRKTKSADGRKFEPPKYLEAMIPLDLTKPVPVEGPDRYAFYGIVTGSRVLPIGQGPGFQTAAADDDKKRYYISPAVAEEFKFGETGPFKAVVGMVTGPSSVFCDSPQDDAPNANITRSDEFQLRFTVKTDICVYDVATESARVVDTMDAEFVVPFGKNYFRETAPRDIVTPGTELYIDEFLRDAVVLGIPIPPTVLLSDGTYPANFPGSEGDDNPVGKDGDNKTKSETRKCICTCEEYERIKKILEEAVKNKSQDRKLLKELYCYQKCMPEFRSCFLK